MVLTFTTSDAVTGYGSTTTVEAVNRAVSNTCVTSGLTTTQRGAGANMSVDVASGYWKIAGVGYGNTSTTNVVIDPADSTNLRYDVIYADSSGISVTKGTVGTSPTFARIPNLAASRVPLAVISVGAGVTSILTANCTDVRVIPNSLQSPPIGSIMAWAKSLTGVPSLPSGWAECNGSVVSDTGSPLNGTTLPSLNSGTQRFLRGSTTSGTTGGSDIHTHTIASSGNKANAGALTTIYVGTTDATSTLPSYYEVVWIIRIK